MREYDLLVLASAMIMAGLLAKSDDWRDVYVAARSVQLAKLLIDTVAEDRENSLVRVPAGEVG